MGKLSDAINTESTILNGDALDLSMGAS